MHVNTLEVGFLQVPLHIVWQAWFCQAPSTGAF